VTEKQRKPLFAALKILISAALIYFIFTKIDFGDVFQILRSANPIWLLGAVILYTCSKIMNSFRLNLYFHAIGVKLTQQSNLKLYLLGMFYNLFLPGGIGGDAYKGYVVQKQFNAGTKKVIGVLLLDRLSGMLLIIIYALLLAASLDWSNTYAFFNWAYLVLTPLGIFVFWWINKKWFSYAIKVFWGSFFYSAALQLVQILAVFCIMKALSVHTDEFAYLFIFMVSSIVSVIPLTIGGFGSREVTFLYGSLLFALDQDISVGISLTFMAITAFISLMGMLYHFKKPKLETVSQ